MDSDLIIMILLLIIMSYIFFKPNFNMNDKVYVEHERYDRYDRYDKPNRYDGSKRDFRDRHHINKKNMRKTRQKIFVDDVKSINSMNDTLSDVISGINI